MIGIEILITLRQTHHVGYTLENVEIEKLIKNR